MALPNVSIVKEVKDLNNEKSHVLFPLNLSYFKFCVVDFKEHYK